MNDAQLFSRERGPALSRLNDAERRVLWLLAEGHTAKSIAAELGTTTSAVNERLREARRKTGVGSSRELARRFKAQENRHEQIGVGSRSAFMRLLSQADAEPWRPHTGVFAMIGIFIVAAAGAAALMSQQPETSSEADPLFASIFAQQQDPMKLFASHPKSREDMDRALAGAGYWSVMRQLHAKVHSEPHDAASASGTETALRRALVSIPRVGAPGTELRVLCARSICEIAGAVDMPADGSSPAVVDEFNRTTMSRLNPHALERETDKLRLEIMLGGIATMSQTPPRLSYVFYYSRAK